MSKEELLNNNLVTVKEEFDIAGIIFPKGISGVCTFQGNKGFVILFETFKIDPNDENKCWITLSNQYQQYFEIIEVLKEPWYKIAAFKNYDKDENGIIM